MEEICGFAVAFFHFQHLSEIIFPPETQQEPSLTLKSGQTFHFRVNIEIRKQIGCLAKSHDQEETLTWCTCSPAGFFVTYGEGGRVLVFTVERFICQACLK